MSVAWAMRFPVRLSCRHLVTYSGTAPAHGAEVYCGGCNRVSRVASWYFEPARPHAHCRQQHLLDGTRYHCTLSPGHDDGGRHYDGPLDAWFAAPARLRASRQGAVN